MTRSPLMIVGVLWLTAITEAAPPVRFARDVRPILSDTCSKCHGPDATARQAELRLDTRAGLFATRDDGPLVVPGRPEASLLLQRIAHGDAELRMPPAASGKSLTAAQIDVIRRWIAEGATWEDHWSFIPPRRSAVPDVARADWSRTAIDPFVLAVLEQRAWTPQPEATAETLVRRVTLDLTGLPPTIAEVDAYLADASPDRYERLVDRLLASPRHGEHLAVDWLDAARYADTSGYQNDGPRQMWRWRDWVIDAFNAGMPFDQFTIEQLAGDLLLAEEQRLPPTSNGLTTAAIESQPRGYLPRDPRAVELLVATGFQRNHRGNSEGGIIAEEYAVEYVADRVDTTGAVWLGLTVGCARCHSHKYDPLTQSEYYQLFAYFNQVPENGRAVKEGNSPPYITAPTTEQWRTLHHMETAAAEATRAWNHVQPKIREAQRAWETGFAGQSGLDFTINAGLVASFPLQTDVSDATRIPSVGQLNAGEAAFVDGPRGRALQLDGQQFLDAGDQAKFGYFDAFSASAWINPAASLTGGIVSRTSDDGYEDGWTFQLVDGKLQVNLVKRWLDDAIRVETRAAVPPGRWSHVAMTYDGSRTANGIVISIDGVPQPLAVHYDFLNQTFTNEEPLRIGATGTRRRLAGALADVRIYGRRLSEPEVGTLATRESIAQIIAMLSDTRTSAQTQKLQQCFLQEHASADIARAYEQYRSANAALQQFLQMTLPTAMVMVDQSQARATTVLQRGVYDRPGAAVTPGVPAALAAGTGPVSGNRLDFARWLVHPQHPLTARVAVNNLWQRFFGIGLVKTSEDFGTQGEAPSHPELLDWLAVELVESGWNLRHIERLIATSATYRQSSQCSAAAYQSDPQNRWLARGPRFRLSAEMLRDQALAIAGLLEERLGGPSIKPYQPAGLWQEIATDTLYEPSPKPDVDRRSLYCYAKRTVANPTLTLFDASTREACSMRRGRTNTPLQALALLNDVTYVDAARALGEAAWREAGPAPEAAIAAMFRRVTARHPQPSERHRLQASWSVYRQNFVEHPETARALLRVGVTAAEPLDETALAERAACAAVASVLLNLDEVVTKE
ncbi:MAG: DUF1553 domain-containing protein [Planctomycetaceae bacterium]|nr:DUF1553 domain-containing protein [Planctomycetaceae bacterium]